MYQRGPGKSFLQILTLFIEPESLGRWLCWESVSLVSQTHVKEPSMMVPECNPGGGEAETGVSLGQDHHQRQEYPNQTIYPNL